MTQLEARKMSAYWYAVGRHDEASDRRASRDDRLPPDHAEAFMRFAEVAAGEHYGGRSTFLPSVADQWRQFIAEIDAASAPHPTHTCSGCGIEDHEHPFAPCEGGSWVPA